MAQIEAALRHSGNSRCHCGIESHFLERQMEWNTRRRNAVGEHHHIALNPRRLSARQRYFICELRLGLASYAIRPAKNGSGRD
jgi:hypothetical protein